MEQLTLLSTPAWVTALVGTPAFRIAADLLLTSAYWLSGVSKLLDWPGALQEERSFGLTPPAVFAALTIAVQLVGSFLVISGVAVWLGAGMLGIFTFAAMIVAYPFWRRTGSERLRMLLTFCEHLGLIAGLMLATILSV
jgi:uncharacterized membrane protein YphA (DoxX/SURF4 family)